MTKGKRRNAISSNRKLGDPVPRMEEDEQTNKSREETHKEYKAIKTAAIGVYERFKKKKKKSHKR